MNFDKPPNGQKEGFFARHSRPTGPPRANLKNIPFEQWDWKTNDPGFYEDFKKLKLSKDP